MFSTLILLVVLLLFVGGCTTVSETVSAPETVEAPIPLSDDGKRYLQNVYLFSCATEYLSYPDGGGPPVPARTPQEWSEREAELTACLRTVEDEYTTLQAVRAMTWNGSRHTMSPAEMKAVARDGDAFLREFVNELLESERSRAGAADLATRS